MEKKKLLIADENEEFQLALTDALKDYYQIRCCSNGREINYLLRTFCPDILVLDLMLPEADGLSLLESAVLINLHPLVIVTTRFTSPYIELSLMKRDVAYMMMKPCNIQDLVYRVLDLQRTYDQELRNWTAEVLNKFKMRSRRKGYTYLLDAVPIAILNPKFAITRDVYPVLKKKYQTSEDAAYHAIREAIDSIWTEENRTLRMEYFPYTEERPDNSDFISGLAAYYIRKFGNIRKG